MWQWRPDSDLVTGRDRVGKSSLGQRRSLTLACRADADGEGGFDFDILLPCPTDPECTGPAWAPGYSVTDLHQALTGAMDSDPDLHCTVHGYGDVEEQDHGAEGRHDDVDAQGLEVIGG